MNLGGAVHINKTGIVVIVVVFFLLLIYINSRGDSQSGEHVSSTINLKKLVQVAVKAAENGGVEVVKGSKHDLKVIVKGKTKEGLDDKVTPADRMSNCAMVAVLKSAFPTLTVISEEETTDCNTNERLGDNLEPVDLNDEIVDEKDLTIWIDPLDATYEYTHRLHQYVTTMVCVAFKGKPIIGVIHNPFLKNTSWAWVGHGMSSNLKKITLPSLDSQKKVTVVVSMSHAGDVKEILQKHFKDKELEIKTAAGAGYKVLQVASGSVDAYIHVTEIKKWDICAGNAILTELGGKMTTKDDSAIDYSNFKNNVTKNGIVASLRNHEYFVSKF